MKPFAAAGYLKYLGLSCSYYKKNIDFSGLQQNRSTFKGCNMFHCIINEQGHWLDVTDDIFTQKIFFACFPISI